MNFSLPNDRSLPKSVRFLLISLFLMTASSASAAHCTPAQFSRTFTFNTDTYTPVFVTGWTLIGPVWTRLVTYNVSRVTVTTHACYATRLDYLRNRNLINPISTITPPFAIPAVVRREWRYWCPFPPNNLLPPTPPAEQHYTTTTQADTLPTTYPNSLEAISDSIGYPGERLNSSQVYTFADIMIDYSVGFNRAAIPMNTLNQINATVLPNDRLDTIFIEFRTGLLNVAADLSNGNPQNPSVYQNFSQLLNELANYPDLVQEPVYTSALAYIQDAATAMGNMAQIVNGGFPTNNEMRDFTDEIELFRQGLQRFSNEVHHNISDLSHSHTVPTLSEWGLVFLVLLVLNMGGIAIHQRRRILHPKEEGPSI